MTDYGGHRDQSFGHITYAQNGEDLVVLNIFRQFGIERPSYLDLGAHHPTHISNTKLLYDRGSRGVNVDANPYLLEAFYRERPEDRNVSVAVGVNPGEATLFMHDEHSGRNTLNVTELVDAGFDVKMKMNVEVLTINQIVEKYCGAKFPDFLSVDLEGLDYEVIASANFAEYGYPSVICIEAKTKEPNIFGVLCPFYDLEITLGDNNIYVLDTRYDTD